MRKLSMILALVMLFTAVCSAGVSASTVLADDPDPVIAVLDVPDGGETQEVAVISIDDPDDAPDAQEIAACDGYALMMGDEVLLTVEQTVVPSLTSEKEQRYYSAEFVYPGTEKRFYLVGLDADRIEEIQTKILFNYVSGTDFSLEELTFIDAEKTADDDMDDELCWAAGAANLLTYTGWASLTDFETEDDILDAFVEAYDNKAGNPYYGIAWFFNGVNNFAVRTSGASSAAAGSGGFIRDYAVEQVASYEKVYASGTEGMDRLFRRLENGWGAALSISLYSQGHYAGGHTVTCWGFVEDGAYEKDDPAHYAGLFVADSDSDELTGEDRRLSPNVLQAAALSPCTEPEKYNGFSFMTGSYLAAIDECDYLMPYSKDVPAETDEEATRDKVHSPDIFIPGMFLGTDFENASQLLDKIESGVTFFYTPILKNMSDVNYEGAIRIQTTVTDADGSTVFTRNSKSGAITIKPEKSASYGTKISRTDGLPAGDYTMTFVINSDHPVDEAFYYNNSYSYNFKVRDSYIVGDADGNGEVDILDATLIQRLLARYDDNVPDRLEERLAATDEVSIIDATLIQRYRAHYEVSRPFGEKRLYE